MHCFPKLMAIFILQKKVAKLPLENTKFESRSNLPVENRYLRNTHVSIGSSLLSSGWKVVCKKN